MPTGLPKAVPPAVLQSEIRYGWGGLAVPPMLAERRLPVNPTGRLDMEEHRFLPRDDTELLASIFTWWNLLDGVMLKHEPQSRFMAGYIREVQLRRMLQIVRQPNITHYCEVGMNGGHSVVAMMLANPKVNAHVFDLMRWNYSQPVKSLLSATFRSRFELHEGYSYMTLPPYVQRASVKCDLLLVDGGHTAGAARRDLQLLRQVAAPGALIVVDDINADPGQALARLQSQKMLRIQEAYYFGKKTEHNPCQRKPKGKIFPCKDWGFAIAKYTENSITDE